MRKVMGPLLGIVLGVLLALATWTGIDASGWTP